MVTETGTIRAETAGPRPAGVASRRARGRVVNDVHSGLNRTRVRSIRRPDSIEALRAVVEGARAAGRAVSVAGGQHAMGGQQFARGEVLVDTSRLDRVLRFDPSRGEIVVEAGIQWPALVSHLVEVQRGRARQFGIIQKQTGADRLSVGGALAANIHGRGLALKPIINDVESFDLVDAAGRVVRCSRRENRKLFGLAVGGYGLFGVVARVTLRLAPRRKLRRVVRLLDSSELMRAFDARVASGFLYGDFQFMTDPTDDGFLRRGVFSCYEPVADDAPEPPRHKELSPGEWGQLLYLAHADRRRAFDSYAAHYLSTDGQLYWSDTHQLSVYLDGYHRELDGRLGAAHRGSEMITEVYVPRPELARFLEETRADFRARGTELIYGTVRLIERDDESFLAWANQSYACVVFNLHVAHTRAGVERAKGDFRRLIDRAAGLGGSYYLTYHRWATRGQVLACYPQFPEFLRLKREHDPAETFQSDWYRHYKALFAAEV